MKLTESNSVNLDKPLAESAVAPGECGSVPDEPSDDESLIACLGDDAAKLMQSNPGDEMATTMLVAAIRISQLLSRLQPPNNQQNSDHVAVIGAKPDSDHLDKPAESADTRLQSVKERAIVPVEPTWEMVEAGRSRILHKEYVGNVDMMLAYRAMIEVAQSGVSSPNTIGQPNEQNAVIQTEQPSLSPKERGDICASCHTWADCGKAGECDHHGYSLLAQRQDSDMTFSGYFDEDEYQGITIEKFLKHRNESEGMDAWEIGHEFQVDAVYSRTEQWRVTNDVPWTAERIDCAAIANGAPK